jgi:hypothetical protein
MACIQWLKTLPFVRGGFTNDERVFALLFLLMFIVSLPGCATEGQERSPFEEVNTLEGLQLQAKPGTITPTGMTVVFCNTTERDDFIYGVWFCIEEKRDGVWYTIPPLLEEYKVVGGGPTVGYEVPSASAIQSGVSNEMEYDWTLPFGTLEPGMYRLLTIVNGMAERPNSKDYFMTAEFSIGTTDS